MWVDEEVHAVSFDKHYYEELMLRAWRFRDPENSGGRNFVASQDPQTIADQMTAMLPAEKQDWTWGGGNGGNARYDRMKKEFLYLKIYFFASIECMRVMILCFRTSSYMRCSHPLA